MSYLEISRINSECKWLELGSQCLLAHTFSPPTLILKHRNLYQKPACTSTSAAACHNYMTQQLRACQYGGPIWTEPNPRFGHTKKQCGQWALKNNSESFNCHFQCCNPTDCCVQPVLPDFLILYRHCVVKLTAHLGCKWCTFVLHFSGGQMERATEPQGSFVVALPRQVALWLDGSQRHCHCIDNVQSKRNFLFLIHSSFLL